MINYANTHEKKPIPKYIIIKRSILPLEWHRNKSCFGSLECGAWHILKRNVLHVICLGLHIGPAVHVLDCLMCEVTNVCGADFEMSNGI